MPRSLRGTRTSRLARWPAPRARPSSAPRPRGSTSSSPRSSGPTPPSCRIPSASRSRGCGRPSAHAVDTVPGVLDVDTPHGPARVHVHAADEPGGALVLGHGAGGGVTARDLVAATEAARSVAVSVALVEQPY